MSSIHFLVVLSRDVVTVYNSKKGVRNKVLCLQGGEIPTDLCHAILMSTDYMFMSSSQGKNICKNVAYPRSLITKNIDILAKL